MLIVKEPSKLLLAEKYVRDRFPMRHNCNICRCEFISEFGERDIYRCDVKHGPMVDYYRVVCPGCHEEIATDGVLITAREFLAIIEAKEKATEEAEKKESAPRYDDEED